MADPTGNDEKVPAFTIKPIEAAQHGPPTNVRFRGVLAMDPRLQQSTVPPTHRNHPLVKNGFFYTVPEQLLKSTCRPQVGESFEVDEALLRLELDLSQISGDHGSRVGFWNEVPIICNLMADVFGSLQSLGGDGRREPEHLQAVSRRPGQAR